MDEQAPQIRPYRHEDLEPIHELVSAASAHDVVDPKSTLENIPSREELQATLEATGDNENSNVLVATDERTGEVMGYGVIRWWREEDGTFLYLHSSNVHPSKRRQGVGTVLLHSLQERIKAIANEHPEDAPKFFGANATSTSKGTNEMLEKDGYSKVWSLLEMELTNLDNIESVTPPEGYELRPVTTDEEKRAVYDANKTVYAGQFAASPASEADYQEFLEDNPDSSLWKVLWKDNTIAGFVLSKADNATAEIMEVSVMPDFRRQGLGKYLMLESMLELKDRGVDSIRLHTDTEGAGGGRPLYESLGFTSLKEHYRYRKPLP